MIKGLCIETGEGKASFIFEGLEPLTGRYYSLEDVSCGSNAQNKLFHALITVFYDYMFDTNTFIIEDNGIIYDFSSDCVESFKDLLKARYGLKFSHINYVNDKFEIVKIPMKAPEGFEGDYDPYNQIPLEVLQDFNNGNSKRIKGVLVSWSDYSMPQRHKLITKVFGFMDLYGVDCWKYDDIKNGLIQLDEDRKAENRRGKNGN